ncbi:MAG: hypothetical protein VB016_05820 [Methanomassiliicoccaceae archaeon]|nr:hypothetical protein [Methanomassiliicoccaceae archaeon]
MDDSNNNGRNYKVLMVPVIALLLCSLAIGGLAYGATNASTVVNTGNVVSFEGLEARLLDEEGNLLTGAGFNNGVQLAYYFDEEANTYTLTGMTNVKIGGGTLFLRSDRVTSVNISYVVEFSVNGVKTENPFGLTITHELREVYSGTPFSTASVDKNGEEYEIELYASFDAIGLSEKPDGLTYAITIIITPGEEGP